MKKQHIEIDPFGGESEEDEIKRIQKVVDEAEKAKTLCHGECTQGLEAMCAEGNGTFICTRLQDHSGPHIACGTFHGYAVWTQ